MAGLSITVHHASGKSSRYGERERGSHRIARPQFSTTASGGFEQLSATLQRDLREAAPEGLYDQVSVVDDQGRDVFEGRLESAAASTGGGRQELALIAVGNSASLVDQGNPFLGIDRGLDRWGTVTNERRRAVIAAGYMPADGEVRNGVLALRSPNGKWETLAGRPWVEAEYNAGPLRIARVLGEWSGTGLLAGGTSDNNWLWDLAASGDRNYTSVESTGDRQAPVSSGSWNPVDLHVSGDRHVACVQLRYDGGAGGSADDLWEIVWRGLAPIGDHGLPLIASPSGVLGLDAGGLIEHFAARNSGVTPGDIARTGVSIPHFAQLEATSDQKLIEAANAFHAYPWGVWEGSRLDWKPWSETGSTWLVPAGRGSPHRLSLEGARGVQLFDSVTVQWRDGAGETFTVGPDGALADAHAAGLRITDENHPAVRRGVPRPGSLVIDSPFTLEAAVQFGRIWLAEQNQARRAGTVTIAGDVERRGGGREPSHMVRAGDKLIVTDGAEPVVRRIVSTNHQAGGTTCQVDNTRPSLARLMAYVGAIQTGRL